MVTNKIHAFENLLYLAFTYLPTEVYDHSLRVMLYVMCNDSIPECIHDDCILVAIAHDLMEDADLDPEDFPKLDDDVWYAIELLTKKKDVPYLDYIKEIKSARGSRRGNIAYWVKVADMKDHLSQKETLTEHLKKKYLEAMPFLLP